MYNVVNDFKEKNHKGHVYRKGDLYPAKGFKADSKRVSFLQSKDNDYKKAFLGEEVKTEKVEKKEQTKKKPAKK